MTIRVELRLQAWFVSNLLSHNSTLLKVKHEQKIQIEKHSHTYEKLDSYSPDTAENIKNITILGFIFYIEYSSFSS